MVIATPLPEELCERIERAEPRIELIRDQSLLPPERWPADFPGDPSFQRTPVQQARFEELLDSADVLYGIPDVDPAALARTVRANPRLRWVQLMAAGGGSQVQAAGLTADELARVRFTTSAGVHGDPLAEFAVFGVFAGAKRLPRLQRDQRAREWPGRWGMAQVSGQTVLVLGVGGIGRGVAAKLAAIGAHVIGTSRRGERPDGLHEVVHPDDIAAVLPRVDALVNTLPGTDATGGLVDGDVFAAACDGLTVVNVGRGTVIDEVALVRALEAGRVGFAALDVFAVEPLPPGSPLWNRDDVLVSPHTAALSTAEEGRIADLFIDNATRFLDGRELRNVVDTVEFY
ncbi:D-2-hydroxyacid dehydrogenase [Saccharopolyspora sp. 6M]|uniref:D-2-hydroxyacid dehydrogenase n=1 Tax=Saccharopolyspora sp. 6M TaxID=2877237 RepID=UPI001CD5E2F5|nr:D-2-hydroxyacid dehydrogenase [Saccharopolyspora sp. 6M]MCA1228842.1 D-2-hydroxyacid dehydrogenase [Saccharopolyspora sp. 6M]